MKTKYTFRCFLQRLSQSVLFAGAIVGTAASLSAKQPNILYIMSDDHAAHGISAYKSRLSEVAPTPNIDRIANEGALLENVFCSNSICTPSRATILTSQYGHNNGVFDLSGTVKPEDQMLAIQMKAAGYQTAMIGKWHLKEEPNFDYYCVLPGQGKYHNPTFRLQGEKPWPNNTIKKDGFHSSDAITDISLNWLKNEREEGKPFFLMHHFKAPHDYFEFAKRYKTYLADVEIPMPENMLDRKKTHGSIATRGHNDELVHYLGTSIGPRNQHRSFTSTMPDFPETFAAEFPENYDPANHSFEENTKLAYQAYLKAFLRCVKGVDDNIGRLLAYLEESGELDNTIIVYTADQGFMLGEHDYQDKRWIYEEALRMPFVVRYPAEIKAGQRLDALVENVDFAPTLLDYAGGELAADAQGKSIRSILASGQEPADWRDATYYRYWMHLYHHWNPGHLGLRTKTHKLVYFYGCGYDGEYQTPPAWELYDLVADPQENKNLYDDPAYADIAKELKQKLADLRLEVGDDGSHHPQCEKVVQEFWDYDAADRARAIEISKEYLATDGKGPNVPKKRRVKKKPVTKG